MAAYKSISTSPASLGFTPLSEMMHSSLRIKLPHLSQLNLRHPRSTICSHHGLDWRRETSIYAGQEHCHATKAKGPLRQSSIGTAEDTEFNALMGSGRPRERESIARSRPQARDGYSAEEGKERAIR